MTLNTKDFSCVKGEDNVISTVKHGGDVYWMIFESGTNNLKITSEVIGGQVKVEYYPSYF